MASRKHFLRLALALSMVMCAPAHADSGVPAPDGEAVYKIRALTRAGERVEGSAVLVAAGELVTNCHAVRDAERVELTRGGASWAGEVRGGDAERDLCVLAAPDITAPGVKLAAASALLAGDTVYAVGISAGSDEPSTSRGRVESLYAFQGGWVIQTSAAFSPGASGGALLDAAGRLVGVLTFRVAGDGKFHFAVPADWIGPVRSATSLHGALRRERAFWERSPDDLPRFLRAAWFEAKRRWPELFAECQRWAAQQPGSAEPAQVMVRAVDHMLSIARTSAPGAPSAAGADPGR